jgi:hypothetical protein
MGTPQIILLVLVGLNLLANAYLHGKPKTGKHNMFLALLNAGIIIWILVAGGFFE